jgi:hypothetical protein
MPLIHLSKIQLDALLVIAKEGASELRNHPATPEWDKAEKEAICLLLEAQKKAKNPCISCDHYTHEICRDCTL